LPELSTILSAARLQQFDMVLAGVFGTNLFNLGLLIVADAFYPGDPILATAGRFEVVACLLCILLTAIFMLGLIERRDRAILRMGYDSIAVLCVYACGLAILAMVGGS
jgi:cation:H+ antiporter